MWDLLFLQEEDSWPDEDRTEVEKFATLKLTVMRTRHSSCDKNKQSKTHYLLSHAVWETCDSIGDNSSTVVPSYGTLKTGLSLQQPILTGLNHEEILQSIFEKQQSRFFKKALQLQESVDEIGGKLE